MAASKKSHTHISNACTCKYTHIKCTTIVFLLTLVLVIFSSPYFSYTCTIHSESNTHAPNLQKKFIPFTMQDNKQAHKSCHSNKNHHKKKEVKIEHVVKPLQNGKGQTMLQAQLTEQHLNLHRTLVKQVEHNLVSTLLMTCAIQKM